MIALLVTIDEPIIAVDDDDTRVPLASRLKYVFRAAPREPEPLERDVRRVGFGFVVAS
jgi:hypothetical protein